MDAIQKFDFLKNLDFQKVTISELADVEKFDNLVRKNTSRHHMDVNHGFDIF
jgi:hypothetical protein